MTEPLILLCPGRSFSSVVSTMLGQHPQMYGFPELNLFVADTMAERQVFHVSKERPQAEHGLLRTLAQIHDGYQIESTIFKAKAWIDQKLDWSTKQVFDYLIQKISPKIGIDKSPITVMKPEYIDRAYKMFPQASFLHLTRHPVSTAKSMQEFFQQKIEAGVYDKAPIEGEKLWFYNHNNIMDFTDTLPTGQSMRIRGEDLLSNPDLYLSQISEWLGIRGDREPIEAMKHPENSPYACRGPVNARFGNDVKFLDSPYLRVGKISEPSLSNLKCADEDLAAKIIKLAQQMGYQ